MAWGQTVVSVRHPDAQVRELRRKVEDAGLVVSNVSNTLDWDTPLSSRDPALRDKARHHITRQIEAANILGTDAILVVAGLVTEDTPYNEVYRRTVDNIQQLSETASRAKVRIGCESCCSEQRFLISPREFETFLNDVNSPWVGLHLDVATYTTQAFPNSGLRFMALALRACMSKMCCVTAAAVVIRASTRTSF
jgi:hexulose-6-phosphate isomerase